MTASSWGFLGAATVVAVVDWLAIARGSRAVEYVCKPATLLLLLAAAEAVDPLSSGQRAWFVAALGLSLAGDILLMLPAEQFTAGLASFLLAHLAYITGFRVRGGSIVALLIAIAVVALVAAFPAWRILGALQRSRHVDLVAPVALYVVVLSLMGASAIALGSAFATAGAVLFMVSDTLIAWNRFVRQWPRAQLTVMITYHLGQAGLVVSLVR